MNDINNLTIIGRLTDDVELKYTPNGMAIGSFSIACNYTKKQGDQYVDMTSFFDVSLFGKSAENLKPYLTKGKQVAINGSLKQERWQDKDGGKRSRVLIYAQEVELLGENQQQALQQAQPQQQAPQQSYGYGFPDDIAF